MLMLDTMDFNNFRKLPTLPDETASPPGTQPTLAQPVPSRSTNSREDDLLICDVCSYATNKSEKFALHLLSHANSAGDDPKEWECEVCNKSFKNRKSLHGHLRKFHGHFRKEFSTNQYSMKRMAAEPLDVTNAKAIKLSDSITNIVKNISDFKAPSLPKSNASPNVNLFENQDKLSSAIDDLLKNRVAETEKKAQNRRTLKFQDIEEIKALKSNHVYTTNSNINQCRKCRVQFSHKLHLARHKKVGCAMFTQHESQTRECCDCDFECHELNVLLMHKRHCQAKISPKFIYDPKECTICSRVFPDFESLGKHCQKFEKKCGLVLNEELQINDLCTFTCYYCDANFDTIEHLILHIQTETDLCLAKYKNLCLMRGIM